jgi:hypothetical protein
VKPLAFMTLILLPALAWGQHDERSWKFEDQETIRRSFDVSSASNPKKLLVDNFNGFIHVGGYGGKEVQVTVEKRIRAESAEAMAEAKRDVKLDMSQQGNFVRLYEDGPFRNHDRGDRYYGYHVSFEFEIQVPSETELVLKGFNQEIQVKKTTGDFDIHGFNGGIDLEDVSGSGSVQTFNGKVKVAFSKNPARETHFKTFNGSVDVYFQPTLDADLHFKTFHGAIYTDFDVTALPTKLASGDSKSGKFVYRSSNRMTAGRTGKGGPELSFDTFNGSIRLHSRAL